MSNLKEREQKILDFMCSEVESKGYPPTVREICSAVGIKSTSTAHKSIALLVKEGFLRKDPAKPRALMLVPQDEKSEEESKKTTVIPKSSPQSESDNNVIDIPIVGIVAAGTPITADENMEGTFPVPAEYVKGRCFMLKVKGESMINVGIMDGDLILVEQQNTAKNGDIVVAMIDGFESEATVKTFYREKDYIRLQPENDNMSPIIVRDVSVQGKVKGVFRYFN